MIWTAVAHGTLPSSEKFHGDLVRSQMMDATVGWAFGKSGKTVALLRTSDGGRNWSDSSPRTIRAEEPVLWSDAECAIALYFLDAECGWVALSRIGTGGDFQLLSTTNGGMHWRASDFQCFVRNEPEERRQLVFYKTHGGGEHWLRAGIPKRARLWTRAGTYLSSMGSGADW